jgi:hypothetical protein
MPIVNRQPEGTLERVEDLAAEGFPPERRYATVRAAVDARRGPAGQGRISPDAGEAEPTDLG